jgi:hypothetical protein
MEDGRMRKTLRPAALLFATVAGGVALTGCKVDNRPLAAWGRPVPTYDTAPSPGPLDPGYIQPAAYLQPAEAYAYPARAWRVSRTYYDSPPSYFDYGGAQPWVWAADDRDWMFAEPYDDGYRYYYYEPGETYPYFIQDADYGYAYSDTGLLIALFSAAGLLIAADRYDDYYPRARDYWSRGYALDYAYRTGSRYPVETTVWRERAPALFGPRDRWFQAAAAQPVWREAVVREDRKLPHDNGRRRGWDKGRDRVAEAAPAYRAAEPRAVPPDWRRQENRERKRVEHFARAEDRGQGRDRGGEIRAQPKAWRDVREDRSPGRGQGGGKPDRAQREFFQAAPRHGPDAERGPARWQGDRGSGQPAKADRGQGGGKPHGGQREFVQAAPQHGRDAAEHGPDRPQGDRGGGQGKADRGQGGGGDKGGGDKGGGHGKK